MTALAVEPTETPQPIAGVSPAELRETTIMTVWPSNSLFLLGRMLGQAYAIKFPDIYFFQLGRLIALMSIPLALPLYFLKVLPRIEVMGIVLYEGGYRYRLTNRRVLVERGLAFAIEKHVDLDRFDNIEIDIRPGQAWYTSGDLIFKLGATETFRLEAVSYPEAFRSTCLKAHFGYVGAQKANAKQGR